MDRVVLRRLVVGAVVLLVCYLTIKLVQYSMEPPEGSGCFEQLPADVELTKIDIPYPSDITLQAYPMIDEFFEQKRMYDPKLRFMNAFYATYS